MSPPPGFRAPVILTPRPIAACGIDAARDAVLSLPSAWECDLRDESLTWSSGVFDLFGFPRDYRPDRRETVAMYADHSRDMLGRLRSHAIATCGSFTFEAQITAADGVERWIRVTADTVASNGRATRLYGTKREITATAALNRR